MKEVPEVLREKGLKVTPQRIAIYNMLYNTNEHPTAETIYKALVPSNPTMSLATVYKTLDSFKTSKLVQELNVGEGCSRYDANTDSHPHLVCNYCGRVFDIDMNNFELGMHVSIDNDFLIEFEQHIFYGKCKDCVTNNK